MPPGSLLLPGTAVPVVPGVSWTRGRRVEAWEKRDAGRVVGAWEKSEGALAVSLEPRGSVAEVSSIYGYLVLKLVDCWRWLFSKLECGACVPSLMCCESVPGLSAGRVRSEPPLHIRSPSTESGRGHYDH